MNVNHAVTVPETLKLMREQLSFPEKEVFRKWGYVPFEVMNRQPIER